ncbi:hypothetical protein HK098_004569 [Nowakowskiella sp. JEL0407]|nr:hypothetical protein HK098_004569 [Nowakowskiella sp. JEL0407]
MKNESLTLENIPFEIFSVVVSFLTSNRKCVYELRMSSKRICDMITPTIFSYLNLRTTRLNEKITVLKNNIPLRQKLTSHAQELMFELNLRREKTTVSFEVFIPCPRLNFLEIEVFQDSFVSIIQPELFTPITKQISTAFPAITTLSLWTMGYCDQTLMDLAEAMKSLTQLEQLDLCFTEYNLEGLQRMRGIYFSIKARIGVDFMEDARIIISEGVFECLEKLPRLIELDVRDYHLRSETATNRLNKLLLLDRFESVWLSNTISNEQTLRTIRRYLIDFQPEYIYVFGNITPNDYRKFSICLERLTSLKLLINFDSPESVEFNGRMLEGLKSCRNLSKLEVYISLMNLPQLNDLARSSPNLKSLGFKIEKLNHLDISIDSAEIYKIFSPGHSFLTTLEFMYEKLDIGVIFDQISENSTLTSITIGIEFPKSLIGSLSKYLHAISTNRRCRLRKIKFSRYQFNPHPVELTHIGSGQWRLRYFLGTSEIHDGIFNGVHKVWCAGDYTIAYVCDYSEENNTLKQIENGYPNVEFGLIMGLWAIWYKK